MLWVELFPLPHSHVEVLTSGPQNVILCDELQIQVDKLYYLVYQLEKVILFFYFIYLFCNIFIRV